MVVTRAVGRSTPPGQGIRRTADIEYAVLEADGRISFFAYEDGGSSGAPEKPPGG